MAERARDKKAPADESLGRDAEIVLRSTREEAEAFVIRAGRAAEINRREGTTARLRERVRAALERGRAG